MNRGVIAGIVAGVVVGLVIGALALSGGDGDDDVVVVDPGSQAEGEGREVVTRWTGLQVSADRRTITVSTALPLGAGACPKEDRLVLEIRPDGVVVVKPTFVVPPLDADEVCTQECTAIEMSATAPEAFPEDATFVASPDAVTTRAEGIPLDA